MYRYNLVQRLLHWTIAVCVLGMLAIGLTMMLVATEKGVFDGLVKTFGQDMTNTIYMLHKSFGVVILALMIPRILAKLMSRKPDYRVPLTGFERAASGAVHGLMYVMLILMPVIGWLATAAGGYPVEFFGGTLPGLIGKDPALSETLYTLHFYFGLGLMGLVGLHIAAAFFHTLIKRDGLISRMGFF